MNETLEIVNAALATGGAETVSPIMSLVTTLLIAMGTAAVAGINGYIKEKKEAVKASSAEEEYNRQLDKDERGMEKAIRYAVSAWPEFQKDTECEYTSEIDVAMSYLKAVNAPLYNRHTPEAIKFMMLRIKAEIGK